MVGGGEGAFIGGVHRMAARLDDRWTLVAGAFSAEAARSQAFGRSLGLADDRCYGDWGNMAEAEAARADKIDAVAIVTERLAVRAHAQLQRLRDGASGARDGR